MSHCVNCYNTSTAAPCASVGCLSTNYGKCITYSGPTLTCEFGGIGTFTFLGTSAGATSGTLVFNSVGGSGSGATFAVTTTLGSPVYVVQVVNPGSGYTAGDILTIPFTFANALSSNWEDITASWQDILDTFGGTASPTNDITITVSSVSGVLTNGENLDDVIVNLHERICLISSNGIQGLDYSGFNYACLRQNGVLTGVGTAITTAREFTESVAAALCNIDPRVTSVEKPNITVPSCFTSTITSGTTGLSSILSQYGSMLCTHNTNLDMSSVDGNPCIDYSLTPKPTSNNVYEYINWILDNFCDIRTDLDTKIGVEQTKVNALYSYITGSISGSVPSVVDTSCLSGGSATSNLKDAVVLIKNNLCALNTTVAGLSNPTYTVAWNCFATSSSGGMIANSPYSSLSAFSSTATITAHLNNISAALNALRMKFSLAEFVVSPNSSTACGTYWDITLKPGNAADFFVYDGAWAGKSLNVTVNGSSTGVTKTVSSTSVNFDITVSTSATTVSNLTTTVGGTYWSFPLGWTNTSLVGTSTINAYPALYRNNGIVTIGNNTAGNGGPVLKIAGPYPPSIASGTEILVSTISPLAYRPAQNMGGSEYISATIFRVDSSHIVLQAIPVIIEVTSSGQFKVRFALAPTAPASTDYFVLPLGGVSWNV